MYDNTKSVTKEINYLVMQFLKYIIIKVKNALKVLRQIRMPKYIRMFNTKQYYKRE